MPSQIIRDAAHPPSFPATRVEGIADLLHGVRVEDPYRWLEDESAPDVRAWVDEQNAYTRSVLDALPGRDWIRRRLETYLGIGTLSAPQDKGGRLFYSRRSGRANQPVIYAREGARGPERVLVDPNPLSADGTIALDWYFPSPDGSFLAYGLSESGSEQSTLRVRDARTGEDLADVIPRTRACSLAWEPSGRGFYYTRYPEPGTVAPGQENYNRHVFHHLLGSDPAQDEKVFGEGRRPDAWADVRLSPGGRWLVVVEMIGWSKAQVYLKDLQGGGFVPVIENTDALYGVIPLDDRLVIITNEEAPHYRIFSVDPASPERRGWREIIPAGEDVIQHAEVIGGRIVVEYLRDASSRLRLFSIEGAPLGALELPAIGSLAGLTGEPGSADLYYGFITFTEPTSIYRHVIATGATELWEKVESPIDSGAYRIEQVRFASKDGTPVPMFLVHRVGIERDGNNPVLLTGYGGFNISLTPAFDRDSFIWLERGGVVAVANLRGGGEYGEGWHRAGMLGAKQNVFDDFAAAAEHLIEAGYTRPERLAISGGSNGGLLVGAALTQRPDLFRAVVCAVPLLDMIRYHNFQIARLWIPEYGSSEDAEQFRWLLAYSPYHSVKNGTSYPAVLLTTAASDSRVDPMHARKMAARLQAATGASDRPILLRLESKAGHGQGKPLSKQLDEQTDVYAFLFSQIGIPIED